MWRTPMHTRLPTAVSDVLDLIASGATNAEILEDYPFLEADDITAALRYAAQQTDHTVIAGAA